MKYFKQTSGNVIPTINPHIPRHFPPESLQLKKNKEQKKNLKKN
jgi:hypothetical protein